MLFNDECMAFFLPGMQGTWGKCQHCLYRIPFLSYGLLFWVHSVCQICEVAHTTSIQNFHISGTHTKNLNYMYMFILYYMQ